MNVFPIDGHDNQRLIGFVHAEDHFYDPESGFPGYEAYKSIALGSSFVTIRRSSTSFEKSELNNLKLTF